MYDRNFHVKTGNPKMFLSEVLPLKMSPEIALHPYRRNLNYNGNFISMVEVSVSKSY